MLKRVFESARKSLRRLNERARKLCEKLGLNGGGAGRAAYYLTLAALLVLLGTASRAYRARLTSAGQAAGSRAALAVQTRAAEPEPTEAPVVWVWPLEGEIMGAYSPEAPVYSATLDQWQTHPALDIAGSPGEAVMACGDGTVLDAYHDRLWGNVIVIEHGGGVRSIYAGLNTIKLVEAGKAVKAGEVISAVGDSAICEADLGWHLHFEVTRDGESVDFATLSGLEALDIAGDGPTGVGAENE